nr:hypothetical protein [Saprospiraceae bacterium]
MKTISVQGPAGRIDGEVMLPISKSIANRLLVMSSFETLIDPGQSPLPEDVKILYNLLTSDSKILRAGHAGTAYRFMLVKCAMSPGQRTLEGSDRMHQRPIAPLVDALRALGADICYLGREGYPPVRVVGKNLISSSPIALRADISSQFISALLMAAPYVKNGMDLRLEGQILSRPYIDMTLDLMRNCGVKVEETEKSIKVSEGRYTRFPEEVEMDWSAASYFLGIPLLQGGGQLLLRGLTEDSIQGDAVALKWFESLGLQREFSSAGLRIWTEEEFRSPAEPLALDFTDCPDLAQTMTFFCLASGMKARFRGCYNLNLKETQRLDKLREYVVLCGGNILPADEADALFFNPPASVWLSDRQILPTHGDHRMAMSAALLATAGNHIWLENPEVVKKSFPLFWKALGGIGFRIESDT